VDELDALLIKVNLFGFHFASLDIRQNKIHDVVFKDVVGLYSNSNTLVFLNYYELSEADKFTILSKLKAISIRLF
jgi:phosphoenolpyruvate carboxylase